MEHDEIMKQATAFYAAQVAPTAWVLYAKLPDNDKPEVVWPDPDDAAQPVYVNTDAGGINAKIPVWEAANSRELYAKLDTEYHLRSTATEFRSRPIYILDGFDPADGDENDTSSRNPWAIIDVQLNDKVAISAGILEEIPLLSGYQRLALARYLLSNCRYRYPNGDERNLACLI